MNPALATLEPDYHLGSIMTILTIDVIGTAGLVIPLLLVLIVCARDVVMALWARGLSRPNAQLAPGKAVLFGTVEHAVGAGVAVRVEIDQEGREVTDSGEWLQLWSEVARRILVNPFYLRDPSGRRIRVEPSGELVFVHKLAGLVRHDLKARTQVAELMPGEAVFVRGRLTPGLDPELQRDPYRPGGSSLVLGPPGRNPMLITSERPGYPFFQRARFHASLLTALFAVAIALHATALPFHLLRWCGTTLQARVVKIEPKTTETSEDENSREYFRVTLALPGKYGAVEEDLGYPDGSKISAGDLVPVVVLPFWPSLWTIGARPTGHALHLLAWILVPVVWLMVWVFFLQREKPWYEAKLESQEAGRLGQSPA